MQEEKEDLILKTLSKIFIIILIGIFFSIMLRFLTKNILIDKMKIDNKVIKAIAENSGDNGNIKINWKEEYPIQQKEKLDNKIDFFTKYTNKVESVKKQLEKYSSDFLFGYEKIVEIAKGYENTIKWNLITNTDQNTPIYIGDNYWSDVTQREDYSYKTDNIIEFSKYLKGKNIDFIYVQAPKKTQDLQNVEMLNIYEDYTNKNINDVINSLKENGIEVLDLREKIREEKLNIKELFYKVDHHWTPQTAIWAMRHIASEMNEKWNMNIDLELYNNEKYYTISLEKNYLGSQGRKLTLSKVEPEKFDIVLPSFETKLTVSIPESNIKNYTGNVYETLFDKRCLYTNDYYKSKSYDAYGYNSKAMIHVKNNNINNNEKVLLLADSFSGALMPYMSLGVSDIYRIDLRDFDGSVKSFIEKNDISKVMMLYYPGSFSAKAAEALFEYE